MELAASRKVADRYVIETPLAKGGMGAVYVAHDTRMNARVALKVTAAAGAIADGIEQRFAREARIGHRLGTGRVGFVRASDWGRIDAVQLFLVMDLVEGAKPLDLRTGQVAERLERWRRAAELVRIAHGLGVVHRDLKPANFLQAPDGAIYLTDFGLAKVIGEEDDGAEESNLTMTGIGFGTPCYMPPEQFDDAKRADERADIYALGCMLFEAATGRLPYPGPSPAAVMSAQLRVRMGARPPCPRDVDPAVDRSVDRACVSAIELDPSRRTASVEALITAVFTGEPPSLGGLATGLAMESGSIGGALTGANERDGWRSPDPRHRSIPATPRDALSCASCRLDVDIRDLATGRAEQLEDGRVHCPRCYMRLMAGLACAGCYGNVDSSEVRSGELEVEESRIYHKACVRPRSAPARPTSSTAAEPHAAPQEQVLERLRDKVYVALDRDANGDWLWVLWEGLVDPLVAKKLAFHPLQAVKLVPKPWVHDEDVAEVARIATVETLILSGADITDRGLGFAAQLEFLRELSAEDLSVKTLAVLNRLGDLRRLVLARCTELKDDAISALSCARLEALVLTGCKGITDKSVPALSAFPRLKEVELTGTSVSPSGVALMRHRRPELKVACSWPNAGSKVILTDEFKRTVIAALRAGDSASAQRLCADVVQGNAGHAKQVLDHLKRAIG